MTGAEPEPPQDAELITPESGEDRDPELLSIDLTAGGRDRSRALNIALAAGALVVAGVLVIAIVVGAAVLFERHRSAQVRAAMRDVVALEQRYYADNRTYASALAIPGDLGMSSNVYIVLAYDDTGFCLVGYRAGSSGELVASYDSGRGAFGHEIDSACLSRYRSHAYLTGTGNGTLIDTGG